MIDTRPIPDGVRRRRECAACGERFTTYERAEEPRLDVIKRDGRRERFDRQKLLRGLARAAGGRPVSSDQLEAVVRRFKEDPLPGEDQLAIEPPVPSGSRSSIGRSREIVADTSSNRRRGHVSQP